MIKENKISAMKYYSDITTLSEKMFRYLFDAKNNPKFDKVITIKPFPELYYHICGEQKYKINYGDGSGVFSYDKTLGFYSVDDEEIFINASKFKTVGDLFRTLIHETEHYIDYKRNKDNRYIYMDASHYLDPEEYNDEIGQAVKEIQYYLWDVSERNAHADKALYTDISKLKRTYKNIVYYIHIVENSDTDKYADMWNDISMIMHSRDHAFDTRWFNAPDEKAHKFIKRHFIVQSKDRLKRWWNVMFKKYMYYQMMFKQNQKFMTEGDIRKLVRESLNRVTENTQKIVSAASYIFGMDNNRVWYILCSKRSGNDIHHQGGFYNVPVGMAEPNETPAQTAQRECLEETGINFPINLFKQVGVEEWSYGKFGANFIVVLPNTIEKYNIGEGDWENEKFQWIPIDKINTLMWAYGMNRTAINIFNKFIPKENVNEAQTGKKDTVWGLSIDRWEYLSFTMSKGTAKDFIEKHGEPKSIQQVSYCIDPNNSIGFAFYSIKMMSKKAGESVKTVIDNNGMLKVVSNSKTYAIMKYNFNDSLIMNLRRIFDKVSKVK